MDATARDRVAVVTGAGRGLGRGVAVALARRGHPVVGVARHPGQLAETADIIRSAGGQMVARPADVSDPDAVAAMADFVRAQLGAPSILVNAAGVFGPIALIRDSDPKAWLETIAIDATAAYLTTRAFVGDMIDAGWGRIVNVTSGIENIRELLPYSMSKAAVDRYVRDVTPSLEGTGVIMSLLDPGWLRTDLGGDKAPNAVETCRPGVLVPLLLDDGAPSGKFYRAQDYRTDGGAPS